MCSIGSQATIRATFPHCSHFVNLGNILCVWEKKRLSECKVSLDGWAAKIGASRWTYQASQSLSKALKQLGGFTTTEF